MTKHYTLSAHVCTTSSFCLKRSLDYLYLKLYAPPLIAGGLNVALLCVGVQDCGIAYHCWLHPDLAVSRKRMKHWGPEWWKLAKYISLQIHSKKNEDKKSQPTKRPNCKPCSGLIFQSNRKTGIPVLCLCAPCLPLKNIYNDCVSQFPGMYSIMYGQTHTESTV